MKITRPNGAIAEVNQDRFIGALIIWNSKGRMLDGFDIIQFEDETYWPVAFDYMDFERQYLTAGGPYKTWRGAYSAVGAAFDKVEANNKAIQKQIISEDAAQ
jgi:hypothetical protein